MPHHRVHACRLAAALLLVVAAAAASPTGASAEANSSSWSPNCTALFPDAAAVRAAFLRVGNFPLPPPGLRACRPVRRLRLPSRNLTGTVDWAALANLTSLLTVDLAGNSLDGGVDPAFWRAPALRAADVSGNHLAGALRFDHDSTTRLASLNVSGNRFESVEGVAALVGLESLDVSRNMIRMVPDGLRLLTRVQRLDLSGNAMSGRFPDDLPPLGGLAFLNISSNNFSGIVRADAVRKFGRAAFLNAGDASSLVIEDGPSSPPSRSEKKRRRRVVLISVITIASAVVVVAALVLALVAARCGGRGKEKKNMKKKDAAAAAAGEDDEVAVGAVKVAAAAPVVVLERPLMELTLADLAAATSGFGRESQLAETGGRGGAAYRAVLPGDLHVVVRVVEGAVAGVAEGDGDAAVAAGLREIARLRHPNILPLLGYCIAGNQKLLLFEYMEKGDLHRWLHELPAGSIDTEDMSIDMLEYPATADDRNKSPGDWPTRYRIILGIARGLAFLHQGWAGSSGRRPIVHGHLVPTNILLADDMEPRISDFIVARPGGGGGGDETPEGDVYRFGILVFELVTGQARWDDASTSWARGVVRNRTGLNIVDARLRDDEGTTTEVEWEMTECLQVGFLCTASAPEKRPTMQQVVGLLKDVRPAAAAVSEYASGS
ncbi:hypothetical protein PR202_gb06705 [Eleusine coracana subsp. coracana]|uniref:Protein kinase domain-containing protein n=1 Tax=Eleusine coracana subsp. coracana TaxID=191504 RepID=A0AAV5E9G7_ELECO|nr:hypothetical protein QOZ80_2BG0161130 [Eleusine coracana subsp. coracana]GJN19427.1 hypothetical protein PR202_gb06705 [Eleusine coracana subsp. coracana]